jgi:signal transduction histidine kinase
MGVLSDPFDPFDLFDPPVLSSFGFRHWSFSPAGNFLSFNPPRWPGMLKLTETGNRMRWPIRMQILLPFVGVVLLAVVAMTAAAAALAARRGESQTLSQLRGIIETLAHTNVPYTSAVLQKMRGLSGAHFVACDARGTVIASTLPEGTALPPRFDAGLRSGELETLTGQPRLVLGGTTYLLARMEPRSDNAIRSLVILYPEAIWSRARWDAAGPPLAVGAGAVLLTAVVSGWLAQRFGRRIRLLQEQVASIAAGDFREIASERRQDEIHDLVASVNTMSAQLRQMQESARRSERTRLLAQLAGGLAHQLRNAVTGARMALQLHQRRCSPPSEDQSLAVALRQLALVETQVRGLLSLGRGERSALVPCALGILVEEVAALVEPICEHSLVGLKLETEPGIGEIHADTESLRAAILNLVTNAIEAAGPGGAVVLRAFARDAAIAVEVEDTGRGPPREAAENLFEPFVTTKPEGVGLGLALARQAAVDHAGSVSWRRENERTIFRLTLPAGASHSQSALPVAESEIRNPKSEIPVGSAAPHR